MDITPDSWYLLSSVASNSHRSMQWCSEEIVCFSDTNITGTNAHWQFASLDNSNYTSITIRNRGKGPDYAVAAFAELNQTAPGFLPYQTNEPSQLWNMLIVSTGTVDIWLLDNVSNGTGFNLAERGGGSMYMASSNTTSTPPAQQWIATKVTDITDSTWLANSTTSTTTTPAATTPTNSTAHTDHSSSPSPGAKAGIAIGTLLAFGLLLTAIFYLTRRYKRAKANPASDIEDHQSIEQDRDTAVAAPSELSEKPATTVIKSKYICGLHVELSNTGAKYELPANASQQTPTSQERDE